MKHDFDLDGARGYSPDGEPISGAYNPADYGLPVWRDEDHLPPEKKEPSESPITGAEAGASPNTAPGDTTPKSMTEEEAKRKLCLWAQEQVGKREGDNNWNVYAENPDLARMYGWKPQNQPWCDVFVDTGFIVCFGLEAACAMTYQPLGAGSALCRQSAQYYKEHNAFFKTPDVGDQVFFYASGDINHTGIVVRVYGGSVVTIEGNSSDQVAERVYSTTDAKIAGYGRPNWAAAGCADSKTPDAQPQAPEQAAQEPTTEEKRTYTLALPYLSRGDKGRAVTAVQFQLAAQGYNIGPDGADGDFGGNTERAVKEFQESIGILADGIVGPKTGAALYGADLISQTQGETKKEKEAIPQEAKQEKQPGIFDALGLALSKWWEERKK